MSNVLDSARTLTPRERGFLVLAGVLYAAVAIPVGIRRWGDLEVHFEMARQWIDGLPLYGHPPRAGAWWPPFAVALVAPFARLAQVSITAAKGVWAALGVVCLGWTIPQLPRDRWRQIFLALGAVAAPLNRNFEDLNLNALLLVLLVAAARDLDDGRENRAGVWMGVAAALKVFPAVWLLYLAFRRRWRSLAVGIGVAGVLTLGSVLRAGWTGGLQALRSWFAESAGAGWTYRGSDQSLASLATRLHIGVPGLVLLDLACVALVVVALQRPKHAHRSFEELSIVAVLAVLISPIAWVHYFLLALPAWVVALRLPRGDRTRVWSWLLLVAGVVMSGTATVWSLPLRDALFELSWYTWGALLLLVFLACAPRARPMPPVAA